MKEKKGNQFRIPQNQTEALTRALKLAITANSKERTQLAVELAKALAVGMSEFEVARCKKQALKELEMH